MAKPSSKTEWADITPANRIEPVQVKKDVGFLGGERPGYQHFNWLIWNHGQWIDFFEDVLRIGTNSIIGEDGNIGIGIDNASAEYLVDIYGTLKVGKPRNTTSEGIQDYEGLIIKRRDNCGRQGIFFNSNITGDEYWENMIIRCEGGGSNIVFQTGIGSEKARIKGNGDIEFKNNKTSIGYFDLYNTLSTDTYAINQRFIQGGDKTVQLLHRTDGGFSLMNSYLHTNSYITFGTYNIERMRIISEGRVGIGTNNPFYGTLHVNQDIAGSIGGDLWITNMSGNNVGNKGALSFGIDGSSDSIPNARIMAWLLADNKTDLYFSNSDGTGTNTKMVLYNTGLLKVYGDIKDGYGFVAPTGTIIAFGGETAPDGWLFCRGAYISRTTYAKLFAVIGTNFGAGDGVATFALPDLRGTFLRNRDLGTGRDPNAATRTALQSGGNTGDAVGSAQNSAFQGHFHQNIDNSQPQLTTNNTGYPIQVGAADFTHPGADYPNYVGIPSFGGYGTILISSETRPRNVYVNYIIKH